MSAKVVKVRKRVLPRGLSEQACSQFDREDDRKDKVQADQPSLVAGE
jgi:hypothetical protein